MSVDTDTIKKEDHSDSSEDPLVEFPSISGNELIKKSQISSMDIRGMVVRCTSCFHQINHHDADKFTKHYRLNVIVCKECYEFYGTSEFSQDESGNYNYCTWCGNGGKLYLCDFCPNSFCSNCVRRNFGRAEVSKMSKEGWKCYVCDPQKLKAKIAYCELILTYSKNARKKNEKKLTSESIMHKISGPIDWTETQNWVLPAFEDIDSACKSFKKRLEKLKLIGLSQSKSLRHVIKKMEQIVNVHKSELNYVMKSLSVHYVKFVEQRKEAENLEKSGKLKVEKDRNSDKPSKIELNGDAAREQTEPKIITLDVSASDNEVDVSSENIKSEDKEDVLQDDLKINDSNYKAKIALLEGDTSESDISDNNLSKESKSKDEANKDEANKDEANKDKAKKDEANKDEANKDEANKDEANKGDIEIMNDDVMETEVNSGSTELFVNGTSEVKETDVPTTDLTDSTKEEVVDKIEHIEPEVIVLSSKMSKAKIPKTVRRKLSFLNSETDSSSSISSSESEKSGENPPKKKTRRKLTPKKHRSTVKPKATIPEVVDCSDSKLKQDPKVILQKCDGLLPSGETTIPLPDEYLLDDLDKEINAICKSPTAKKKTEQVKTSEISVKKKKASENKKQIKVRDSSSSSICLSSSEEEKDATIKNRFPKTKVKEDANTLAKKGLLDMDSEDSTSSEDSEDSVEEIKKKKSKKPKQSDSSDDFQPRKKKKFDKLLNKRILSDEESGKEKEKKNPDRKKSTKRKHLTSDDSSNQKKDSDSVHTTTTDSEDDKEKKKKKRKRIKKAAVSSSDNEEGKDGEEKASQSTPGKGRKNIKKLMSKKELAEETKEAQNIERERRKRVLDRQKMYNIITDTSTDGKEIITRKMVLEVDPVSKEEIVQIHPDLCEKLKPHQVKGVRFMWECTIESIKELQKNPGSGCILAHCMGLGKTLQVVTFLHTCLTNELVNKKIRTAMVICPYNTVLNWAKEFEIWLEHIDGDILVHQLTAAKDNYTRMDILKYWKRDGGVLITSYDIFRRLAIDKKIAKMSKKNMTKIRELLVDPGPDIVVCDEGHILKNENSAVSKACSQLATERRIVLTGTPLQNNLMEYHCMLSFVKPHLLGTSKEFRNRFVNPIMNGQYDDSNEYDVKRMKKRIHILHKLLEGCVQRCDYAALTKFLPPKHEFVISVKLSEIQIKMYQWYLDNLSRHKKETKIRGGTLFMDYNVLRNLCTHPYIVHTSYERAEQRRILNDDGDDEETFINDESETGNSSSGSGSGSGSEVEEVVKTYKTRSRKKDGTDEEEEPLEAPKEKRWYDDFISDEDNFKLELSGKMILLIDILKECEGIGDKVILFSQSILTLDIIEDILNNISEQPVSEEDRKRDVFCRWIKNLDYFRMDGTTSADFRKQYIDMFNDPNNDRSRLFLVSTRAGGLGTNLIGANRVVMLDASWNPSHDVQAIFRVYRFGQKKPVYIYRLLAQGTMEEKIYDRQVTKLSLSIRVVDEQQIDRHFNAAELAELYNFDPDSLSNRPTPMVPKDTLLAEMLIKHNDWIVTYHEHDSLLQNQTEEDLTEEERQAAWNEYENEREGRGVEEVTLDGEISEFSKEPDFAQADYVGTMIPNCKQMIESIIGNLKKKYVNFAPSELRKKLLLSIYTLRAMFQEKHVKILRMKQEYVARGSVPQAVNKYLEELNTVLNELATHHDNVNAMVMNDNKIAQQIAMAKLQQQMAANAAMQNAQQQSYQAKFTSNRTPFIPAQYSKPANFPPFAAMHQNLQSRMAQFPGGMNAGLSNFTAGGQRWNTAININTGRKYAVQIPTNKNIKVNATHVSSTPVITEVDKDETSLPEKPNYSNNPPSSVVIEEID